MFNNKKNVSNNISKSIIKHYWLYILKLEQNKYYVGLSTNPSRRIQEHKNGFYSAQFVKKFNYVDNLPFIDLGNVTFDEAKHLENLKTLEFMKLYGYQNVRGGKFSYRGKYIKIGMWLARDIDFVNLLGVLFFLIVVTVLYFDTKR